MDVFYYSSIIDDSSSDGQERSDSDTESEKSKRFHSNFLKVTYKFRDKVRMPHDVLLFFNFRKFICNVCSRSFLTLGEISDHFLQEHVENVSPSKPKKRKSDVKIEVVDLTISPEKGRLKVVLNCPKYLKVQ